MCTSMFPPLCVHACFIVVFYHSLFSSPLYHPNPFIPNIARRVNKLKRTQTDPEVGELLKDSLLKIFNIAVLRH